MESAPAASTCGIYLEKPKVDQKAPRPIEAKISEPPQQREAITPAAQLPVTGAALIRFILTSSHPAQQESFVLRRWTKRGASSSTRCRTGSKNASPKPRLSDMKGIGRQQRRAKASVNSETRCDIAEPSGACA